MNTDTTAPQWRTSSKCSNGTCVEVAFVGDTVLVRNSQRPTGPEISYTTQEWEDFLAGAKNGEFDLS
ncbi:DUF397 domain-containing protein [Actinoplanes sp. NPDC026670]|uniref:DUF397 domain-containing protein n=1 Tax=Actinoplanes sp. NPDC026670 TaxID=3154700 RepID=UPI003407F55A